MKCVPRRGCRQNKCFACQYNIDDCSRVHSHNVFYSGGVLQFCHTITSSLYLYFFIYYVKFVVYIYPGKYCILLCRQYRINCKHLKSSCGGYHLFSVCILMCAVYFSVYTLSSNHIIYVDFCTLQIYNEYAIYGIPMYNIYHEVYH